MIKYFSLICLTFFLIACSTRDGQYYRTHPKALQEVIKDCPAKQPADVSCEQLATIAASINELAYQLQLNPQGFGKKILALQESLAKQKIDLQTTRDKKEMKTLITKNEEKLAESLAVVRWLESPER